MHGQWRIELLGGLRAVWDGDGEPGAAGRVVSRFRTRKTGLLLAYLAYFRQRTHPREELIERFWPEHAPEAGRQSLRKALSSLRQQLQQDGTPESAVLLANRAVVQSAPAVTTDVETFRAALRAAERAPGTAEQARLLAEAVEQYRGELLPGCHEDWIIGEREWLAETYFRALGELLSLLEREGDYERALEYATRGVSADPLREEAHRDLIRLYAAVGQPPAALRQYRELERRLREQLGATPEPATCALVTEIERLAAIRPAADRAFTLAEREAQRIEEKVSSGEDVPPQVIRSPPHQVIIPSGGENRLVTVLFADMSGSLAATAALPPEEGAELVNRLLTAMVDAVLKVGGRIDRFLGDGVLALFGAPQAHEDDAERAVRAAVEIRAAAQRLGLEVTAGINTGEVYLGAVGSQRHQETTVVGPVVSLASRLQGEAAPGQILVGEATYQQTRGAFTFSSRSLTIRGLDQPVTLFTVERALPRAEKARGIEGLRAELIGRDEELTKLQQALEEVRHRRGQIVSLIGEAGVGKSRLVSELRHQAIRPSGHQVIRSSLLWLEGRCLEMHAATAYSLFVDLFRDYFAWQPEEDDLTRGQRLAATLREFGACGELSDEQIEEMGPLLGNLLSLRFGTDWDTRLRNAGPEQIRHQTFLAVRDFFVALAHQQPVILVCEDLHWADSLSLDLLSLLMESLPATPLFLLCIYRPEREHKCWRLATLADQKCRECFTELQLRELTTEQSQRLVTSLLTVENLPAALKVQILAKARGNPFFLEELVRSLIDAGKLYRDGLVWRARVGVESITVPESIQSVILARLDRLRPDLKQLLQHAAVLGRLFRRRWLEALPGSAGVPPAWQAAIPGSAGVPPAPVVAELPGTRRRWVGGGTGLKPGPHGHAGRTPALPPPAERLDQALSELEDLGFVYQERVVPEVEYSFQHVLTQETVYGNLLRRQRVPLHQQVGEVIEALYPAGREEYAEQLAYHYERSAADEKAVEYLLAAGEKARRAYHNEEAISYFERALARLAAPQSAIRNPQSAMEGRLAALKGLGLIHHSLSREPEAEDYLRQAIAVGRQMDLPPRELVLIYFWLGYVLNWRGKVQEVVSVGEEGLALLGDDTECVAAALMNAALAVAYGSNEKWRQFTERNAQLLPRLPYCEELRWPYGNVAMTRAWDDKNLEEAQRWLDLLEQKGRDHHDLKALGEASVWRAELILFPRGDLKGSLSEYRRAYDLFTRAGDIRLANARPLTGLGVASLQLGDLDTAEQYALRGVEIRESVGAKRFLVDTYYLLGVIRLTQGAREKAIAAFRRAVDREREVGQSGARSLYNLGRAYLAQGDYQVAARRLEEALQTVDAGPREAIRTLGALEEAYQDAAKFRDFCAHYRVVHSEAGGISLAQWFLEPATPHQFSHRLFHDAFASPLSPNWDWHDPFGDCSYQVATGLEMHAANGRNLWGSNQGAPRLLRPGAGEFAIQTVCAPAGEGRPAMGGLVVWKDRENYVHLTWGEMAQCEITCVGCIGNEDRIIGRGRLPSERVYLRLERIGGQVTALCSGDGEAWFTVGHVEFPVTDPVQVGLHAIGDIDRASHPGAYPDGTAIRFEVFELWGEE